MTRVINDISQRSAAIIVGLSLLLMAITAGFSVGFVLDALIVPDNAVATTNNIKASEILFRIGILGWLVILLLDVIVAWALHVLLRAVNQSLSLLMAWLRLSYAAVLGVGLLNFIAVLFLLNDTTYLAVFTPEQLQALVLFFLNVFDGIWQTIGLVIFGSHLLLLGYLVLRSGYIPKILGVLLLIAALGYLTINLGNLLFPSYTAMIATIELIFMAPMIVGEVGLGLWFLIKGGTPEN